MSAAAVQVGARKAYINGILFEMQFSSSAAHSQKDNGETTVALQLSRSRYFVKRFIKF